MAELVVAYDATTVITHDPGFADLHGDDHPDHQSVGRVVASAVDAGVIDGGLMQYAIGYPAALRPANIAADVLARKLEAFASYARHDPVVAREEPHEYLLVRGFGEWLQRHYLVSHDELARLVSDADDVAIDPRLMRCRIPIRRHPSDRHADASRPARQASRYARTSLRRSQSRARQPRPHARGGVKPGSMGNHIATASVVIDSSPEEVWHALTDPAMVKQYYFGTDLTTDWQPGSPITWSGEYEGKEYEDHGEILRVDPPRMLQHTHFSPLGGLPDAPENYHTLTYTLTPSGSGTEVTLEQDNNDTPEAAEHAAGNWSTMLDGLKALVEAPED